MVPQCHFAVTSSDNSPASRQIDATSLNNHPKELSRILHILKENFNGFNYKTLSETIPMASRISTHRF
jgi:hypothetical protein